MWATVLILLGVLVVVWPQPPNAGPWLKFFIVLGLIVVAALLGCGVLQLGSSCG